MTVRAVSAPASAASGGSILIEVLNPPPAGASALGARVNGQDVAASFAVDPRNGRLLGLVPGLRIGANDLTIYDRAGGPSGPQAHLAVTNYDLAAGEVLGPHQRPWICETESAGLGPPPASGPCRAETRIDWFYKSTDGTFKPLPGAAARPADLAKTTTTEGKVVDYIVRVESGVIDESIFRIAIIDDPSNPISRPWSASGKKPGDGWNGKLTWPFVGGASPGYRSGSDRVTNALQDTPLSLGFAVAYGSRNTFGVGSDDVVSAENVIMIKQYFMEHYGVPKFTIASGPSGGSMQQHLIANNYPGLLDAITPIRSFPDIVTTAPDVIDCSLLAKYFDGLPDAAAWTGKKRAAVDGYPVASKGTAIGKTSCQTGWSGYALLWQNARWTDTARPSTVPPEFRYDPVKNPKGARATVWDSNKLSLGVDPKTGFARSLYDNVGIQYGLNALNSGQITKAEFLDLNEKIGGRDADGNFIASRSHGDQTGIANAYRNGRVDLAQNLTLPIINMRNYTEDSGDIHTSNRTFAFLDRLIKAHGTRDNVAVWTYPTPERGPASADRGPTSGDRGSTASVDRKALVTHDAWLEAIAADRSGRSYAQKVLANRPKTLHDICWDAAGQEIEGHVTLQPPSVCDAVYPVASSPRVMAGGGLAGDVLKCQTRRPAPADYKVAFTPEEWRRLTAIFAEGVCDWSKPGVGQAPLAATWLRFPAPGQAVVMEAPSAQ